MKRSLLICCAALMMLLSIPKAQADNVLLTLDLDLDFRTQPDAGGQWALYARKVETGAGAQGDFGISAIRALINNITIGSVTYAAGTSNVNQATYCNGGPCVQTLANGAVEITYTQDIGIAGVVTGVGVSANANLDRLIASGTYSGLRPAFGNDGATPTPFTSDANFLGAAAAPFPASPAATLVTTAVNILGDMNGSNTVTNTDIQPFINRLPGAATPQPYIPNGDVAGTPGIPPIGGAQSGTISNVDINPFITLLGRPAVAPPLSAVSAVPEPSSIGLALLASMGLVARRRAA